MNKDESPSVRSVCTPIRRLGLSRRFSPLTRLSSPLSSSSSNVNTNSPMTSSLTPKIKKSGNVCQLNITASPTRPMEDISAGSMESVIDELEVKLHRVNDTLDIERSIEMWKNGLKESLLALQNQFIKENEKKLSLKEICLGLRIWEVAEKHLDSNLFKEELTLTK